MSEVLQELIAEARRWGDALPEMWGPEHIVNRLADALEASQATTETEWGVVYEISSSESEYSDGMTEEYARHLVEESPTDTGLVKRTPASRWEPAS